jgi:hypothetical protein
METAASAVSLALAPLRAVPAELNPGRAPRRLAVYRKGLHPISTITSAGITYIITYRSGPGRPVRGWVGRAGRVGVAIEVRGVPGGLRLPQSPAAPIRHQDQAKSCHLEADVVNGARFYAFSHVHGFFSVCGYLLLSQQVTLTLEYTCRIVPSSQGSTSSFPFRRTPGPFTAYSR